VYGHTVEIMGQFTRPVGTYAPNFKNRKLRLMYCLWSNLAEQLCRDLKELLNVVPDAETAENYENALLSIHKEYFNVMSWDNLNH
jgi:uncharacterized protein VirK/YbjX